MGNAPTPLRRAVRDVEVKQVEKILERAGDGDADLINNDYAQECIMQSCTRNIGNVFYYAVSNHRIKIIPILIKHGADVHTTGLFGETCLHAAVRRNYVTVARMLVDAGCDVRSTDDAGRFAINSAGMTVFNTSEMVRFLLEEVGKKEDVNSRDFSGRTALHEAAYLNNVLVAKTLLDFGADVNAVSNEGNAPLHCARRRRDMWRLLVDNGADQTIRNKEGKTPSEVA